MKIIKIVILLVLFGAVPVSAVDIDRPLTPAEFDQLKKVCKKSEELGSPADKAYLLEIFKTHLENGITLRGGIGFLRWGRAALERNNKTETEEFKALEKLFYELLKKGGIREEESK